jgi:HlyD family secretion protein
MKKWLIGMTVIILIGGFIGYFLLTKDQPIMAQVTTTSTVEKGNIEVNVSGSGTITPLERASIKAKEGGTVKSVILKEGEQVKQGDMLVTFREADLSEQIAQEQIKLEQKMLDLEEAKQQVAKQQEDLVIIAPEKGNLISLNIKEGDEVQSNMVIGSIQDANTMTITASFSAVQLKDIQLGQKAEVFIVDSFSTIEGTVIEVDTIGRATSSGAILYDVTVEVKAQVDSEHTAQVTVMTPNGKLTAWENGNLTTSKVYDISAKTSGTVSKIMVNEQAWVKRGQPLVELTTDDSSSNNIEKLTLDIEQIKNNIHSYTNDQEPPEPILASIDGEIIALNVDEGDEINPGTVIADIANYQDLQVVIPIDELDISKVKVGQTAEITLDALADGKYQGEVVEIAKEGTANNGVSTFDVTIRLTTVEGIRAGMSAQANILVEQKKNVILVPIEAVQEMRGQKVVMIESKQTTADQPNTQMKPVQVGIHNENFIEITEGLQEGEKVVLPTVMRDQSNGFGGFGGGMGGSRGEFGGGPVRIGGGGPQGSSSGGGSHD